ncbi:MAG: TRAP transporter small permease [Acetobacteraceae bacterium]|nr:TRAP transporter small permease [Acetobacteraceae bacterium]
MNTLALQAIGLAALAALPAGLLLRRSLPARRAVLALDRWLLLLAAAGAVAALAVAVGAGAWQVATRFVLAQPSVWSEALVRTALIWMVLLGVALALREGALVSIDLAERYGPPPLRRAVEAASLVAALAFMGVLFWFGWSMAERVRFQQMAGLEVSIAFGYAAIPVGAAFALLGAFARFVGGGAAAEGAARTGRPGGEEAARPRAGDGA